MKFFTYMLVYYFRNKRRFFFTFLTVAVAVSLFCLLELFSTASQYSADESRIMVFNDASMGWGLPLKYLGEFAHIKGAEDVTYFHVASGVKDPTHPPLTIISIDPATYFKVVPELSIPEGVQRQFQDEPNACLIGVDLAEKNGWKAGDRIQLQEIVSDKDFDFVVRGIYRVPKPEENEFIYCHYDYHAGAIERVNGKVLNYVVRVRDLERLPEIAKEIDRHFENFPVSTRSQPERVFAGNVQATQGNFALIFRAIGYSVLLATLLVIANTLVMATREQIHSLATLRVLGFSKRAVQFLVLSEALFVCIAGGAFVCVAGGYLGLGWHIAVRATVLSLALGLCAGIVPAVTVGRKDLAMTLRRII